MLASEKLRIVPELLVSDELQESGPGRNLSGRAVVVHN